jgi:monomeric phenylalanine-4-hydroxylase
MLSTRAAPAFLEGIDVLRMTKPGIPDFDELSERLQRATGWSVVAVPGLIPEAAFFEHLAERRFVAGRFIRTPEQMDYLEEPDVFHDVFGHVPLLVNPVFADYMQAYGQGGLRSLQLGSLHRLARLYWYTVEFGLIRDGNALKLYGAGIVSSGGESRHALESDSPNRLGFDLKRILRTKYRIDDYQQNYFVIDSFEQLLRETLETDFGPLYSELDSLPEFEVGALDPGDDVITAGTQTYANRMTGTLEFDGKHYLDGESSDPKLLGWMEGAPPPPDKRIRFQDDRFLGFPEIRWALSHMRELCPTVNVWRGATCATDLGVPDPATVAAIDAVSFEDTTGRTRTFGESHHDVYTDGIAILHRGRLVYERYFGALQPQGPHACFSITKSYVATIAATLIHEGLLDDARRVKVYLPEMSGTAYADATLRDVLDMQVGVLYSEEYADPKADVWAYARAGGLRSRPRDYAGPESFYELLVTLRKDGEHGRAFAYKTVNTEVLGWIMRRVTGARLETLISERIWSRIGCEQDAYITVDSSGVAMGGGGMSATLRDLARFGELMRCEGAACGVQVVPAAVVADIRRGADRVKFAMAGYDQLAGYSYRDMWWVAHDPLGVFEGRGIHGQRLYIAPAADTVIARFSSHPIATSAANDPVTMPGFSAVCRMLAGG